MKKIFILGASSAIAMDTFSLLPEEAQYWLAGRDEKKLNELNKRFPSRKMECFAFDLSSPLFKPADVLANLPSDLDAILVFSGTMGDPDQATVENLEYVHLVNFINPAKILFYLLPGLVRQKGGHIVVVSSVAGNRGRKKNYVYGSAKGALTILSSGLRAQLSDLGICVSTVLLGMVDSPMTQGMKSPLIADRKKVASKIVRAIEQKKDVVYIPSFWKWIMFMIEILPEKMFKRLSF